MEGAPLIKHLGASNDKVRNKSLRIILSSWLPSQAQLSDDDMKKLWKGLFYCLWHADKLPAQTHLIHRMSSVLPDLPLSLSFDYFSVFLLTMRREWAGIDALRLDKFYLLIRRFLHFFFVMLKKNSWDLDLSSRLMGVLVDGSFASADKFRSNGVNYHVASIFLDELKPFLPLRKETVEVILGQILSVMGRVPDKVLLTKIKSNVFDVLLRMGNQFLEAKKSGVDVGSPDDRDLVMLGSIALALGFSSKFYELASSVECPQGNRKLLLGLHEEFLKLDKDLTSSGIDISIPEVCADTDEDEVPNLVPIDFGVGVNDANVVAANGSAIKHSKKSKKDKKEKKPNAKKAKKKKKDIPNFGTENGDKQSDDKENSGSVNLLTFNESVISNLQMQFEKVVAEVGLDGDCTKALSSPEVIGNPNVSKKKRKRAKVMGGQQPENPDSTCQDDDEGGPTAKSTENSTKKVRFSMKNNLVWKPHSPLPPQSLRIPPSVAPRGSALKKGIPPGPVREMLPATKRVKKMAKTLKKRQKRISSISPAVQRLRKLKSLST